jgi:preprotein translocase subunit SecY
LIVNPQQYADHLKRQNAFIPGVKQGNDTAEYIDDVTTLVTLPGSIALGFISIIPGIAAATITSNIGFAIFYGGTSLLILVAVVLDTIQQIDSHMSMHGYDVRNIKKRSRTSTSESDSVV